MTHALWSDGLRTRLFLTHLLVIVVGMLTLLLITFLTAPTVHDQLMIAMLGPEMALASDPAMAAMERATNMVFQASMIQALLISSAAAVLVAVAVSLVVSSRIVTPIRGLLAASRRIAAGHYTERVPTHGHDDLLPLAAQFNTMAIALEEAERRRVTLIGDVAHELRTPLATIEGYAEGVLDGVVTPDDATWALILDEVGRLRRLVNDLQELSRAEANQLALRRQLIAPVALVTEASARIAPQFKEKQVALQLAVPGDLPELVVDPDRLTQVLINMLGNALQHTPAGGVVTVAARREGDSILVQVQDSGVGIAAEHLPHLFERFYRVDKARARTTGGTGIGLTICKALVEAHGGQIRAESAGLGQGATFTVALPILTKS